MKIAIEMMSVCHFICRISIEFTLNNPTEMNKISKHKTFNFLWVFKIGIRTDPWDFATDSFNWRCLAAFLD